MLLPAGCATSSAVPPAAGEAEISAATEPSLQALNQIDAERRLALPAPSGPVDAGQAERLMKRYAGEARRQHQLAGRAVLAGQRGIEAARNVARAAGKPD